MRHFRELLMIAWALNAIGVLSLILSNEGEKTIYLELTVIALASGSALFAFAVLSRQKERAAVWDLPASGYLDVVLFDEKDQ
jgi:hypothetical protein